jgi:4-alpha-glucanotransferase
VGVLDDAVDTLFAFMQDAGLSHWQVCPLGATGYGDSPYQCFSAFAGNPYLIDLSALVAQGLLQPEDLEGLTALPADKVDYGWLYITKWPVLFTAYEHFVSGGRKTEPYGSFATCRKRHRDWLEPYGLFVALKDHFRGRPWWDWPEEQRFFARAQRQDWPAGVAERAEAHAFFQYLFYGQWEAMRVKARAAGITIIGDAPIFVARDSADVWARPELFQLEAVTGAPQVVAGVPPDYFSTEGQLWGNPLYDWNAHAAEDYAWWIRRLEANFALCDILRIDHFRAFDTYWAIPADAPTAQIGAWEPGPGLAFFHRVKRALPDCRLIAEDLGDLTPAVRALRAATGLPGMSILQFAFGGDARNLYLPHNLAANNVVYPGTHDHKPPLGWYGAADELTRDHVRRYLRVRGDEVGWDFVRAAYAAVSRLAIIPLPDLLNLGAEARFNTPGVAAGNWQWRYSTDQLKSLQGTSAPYLSELIDLYGR